MILESGIDVGDGICGELFEIKKFYYHVEWFWGCDWGRPDYWAEQKSELWSSVIKWHLFLYSVSV